MTEIFGRLGRRIAGLPPRRPARDGLRRERIVCAPGGCTRSSGYPDDLATDAEAEPRPSRTEARALGPGRCLQVGHRWPPGGIALGGRGLRKVWARRFAGCRCIRRCPQAECPPNARRTKLPSPQAAQPAARGGRSPCRARSALIAANLMPGTEGVRVSRWTTAWAPAVHRRRAWSTPSRRCHGGYPVPACSRIALALP